MGIGPSSKETTLHHFKDPLIETISKDKEIDFIGIIVEGTPEINNHKLFVAERAGMLIEAMMADGAIVSIDSWGNSHIDFTSVIQAIGEKNIPVVGLSFVGNQASFVVTNKYMDTVIDVNKNEMGIETTVVGENNVVEMDAIKAISILKSKMKKKSLEKNCIVTEEKKIRSLIIKSFKMNNVVLSEKTKTENKTIYLNESKIKDIIEKYEHIENIKINIINPDNHEMYVNSILDFSPIATKVLGKHGEGITHEIIGVKIMLTGSESCGFQAANIGSSEGILKEKVKLNRRGTPSKNDIIIHVDVILSNGYARNRTGIMEAHSACDEIVQEIRQALKEINSELPTEINEYHDVIRIGGLKVVLVKLVSGLGCMYDTGLFPKEPGGYRGCRSIMDLGNMHIAISPNEYRDGVIRSLS